MTLLNGGSERKKRPDDGARTTEGSSVFHSDENVKHRRRACYAEIHGGRDPAYGSRAGEGATVRPVWGSVVDVRCLARRPRRPRRPEVDLSAGDARADEPIDVARGCEEDHRAAARTVGDGRGCRPAWLRRRDVPQGSQGAWSRAGRVLQARQARGG